jgi:hypothetical protein
MKNIKNIIIGLVCCLCLLGTTVSTSKAIETTVPSEPKEAPAYCMVCVFVCGYLMGYPHMYCLSNAEYDKLEADLNRNC